MKKAELYSHLAELISLAVAEARGTELVTDREAWQIVADILSAALMNCKHQLGTKGMDQPKWADLDAVTRVVVEQILHVGENNIHSTN